MNSRQLIVISACVLIGAAVYLLPRNAEHNHEEHAQQSVEGNESFESQLGEVKKQTPAEILAGIEFFEGKLKTETGKAKIQWLDSLRSVWDRQMRPGIAAEYVLQKAEILNDAVSWKDAGVRFLGISRFFEGPDKDALANRAVSCLEKAQQMAPEDVDVKTQLGIAYVEGSAQPMQGITLLREVVAADSTNVDAQMSLGFFSMKSGQYDKAVKRFKTVIRLRPDLPEMYLYLADALSMEGKKDAALAELDKLTKISKDTILLNEVKSRRANILQN
jgi:tetratricopeptide (TPR) repeat protein